MPRSFFHILHCYDSCNLISCVLNENFILSFYCFSHESCRKSIKLQYVFSCHHHSTIVFFSRKNDVTKSKSYLKEFLFFFFLEIFIRKYAFQSIFWLKEYQRGNHISCCLIKASSNIFFCVLLWENHTGINFYCELNKFGTCWKNLPIKCLTLQYDLDPKVQMIYFCW